MQYIHLSPSVRFVPVYDAVQNVCLYYHHKQFLATLYKKLYYLLVGEIIIHWKKINDFFFILPNSRLLFFKLFLPISGVLLQHGEKTFIFRRRLRTVGCPAPPLRTSFYALPCIDSSGLR